MNSSYRIHLASLTLTKTADGLIDPKLVLAWLLNSIGSPGYFVGMPVVPQLDNDGFSEPGALLPQFLLARVIKKSEIRKYSRGALSDWSRRQIPMSGFSSQTILQSLIPHVCFQRDLVQKKPTKVDPQ